jgi:hypothetical protein
MGPGPLFIAGGALIAIVGIASHNTDNYHTRVINYYLGQQNVGGSLTNICHQHISTIEKYVAPAGL